MKALVSQETEVAAAVNVPSNHPLYILHTSGTTGDPKGIVRDHGGTTVALNYSLSSAYNLNPGYNWFTAADLGWVVGHTLICYGPLLRGCTSILFEGKPVIPDAGVLWRIAEMYKVNSIFTAPTAVREIMKRDQTGSLLKNYDLSALESFHVAGERTDPFTIWWMRKHMPHVYLNDSYWQTETGWPVGTNFLNR